MDFPPGEGTPGTSADRPTYGEVGPRPADATFSHDERPGRQEPPAYATGRYEFHIRQTPTDPVAVFTAKQVNRRHRSDWVVLVVVMIISLFVMAGCCIAGYAIYLSYGTGKFLH
jgi:hypothetical protein